MYIYTHTHIHTSISIYLSIYPFIYPYIYLTVRADVPPTDYFGRNPPLRTVGLTL